MALRDGKFIFNGKSCLENFQVAVALAVAAIPEGLPAVITTCGVGQDNGKKCHCESCRVLKH